MEFLAQKIGMSRTVGKTSTPVTLLKVLNTKVCELKEGGQAIVAYPRGKAQSKTIAGQQKNTISAKNIIALLHFVLRILRLVIWIYLHLNLHSVLKPRL